MLNLTYEQEIDCEMDLITRDVIIYLSYRYRKVEWCVMMKYVLI